MATPSATVWPAPSYMVSDLVMYLSTFISYTSDLYVYLQTTIMMA